MQKWWIILKTQETNNKKHYSEYHYNFVALTNEVKQDKIEKAIEDADK